MSTTYEIPLVAAQQSLSIQLNNVTYHLRITWNNPASIWLLDVQDTNNVPIAQGIALTAGADLLGQLEYLGIGGVLTTQTDSDLQTPPGFLNLGANGKLYFTTP